MPLKDKNKHKIVKGLKYSLKNKKIEGKMFGKQTWLWLTRLKSTENEYHRNFFIVSRKSTSNSISFDHVNYTNGWDGRHTVYK